MKRGTTPVLRLSHSLDLTAVERIDFLFKQENRESAPALCKKTYGATGEVTEEGGIFYLPFTQEETRHFAPGKPFYCDPRITLTGGKIPQTGMLQLSCKETLWGEQDG